MVFSQDSKLLSAQGGAPDWNLVLWQWEKSKVLASIRTSNPFGAPMCQVEQAVSAHARTLEAKPSHTFHEALGMVSVWHVTTAGGE